MESDVSSFIDTTYSVDLNIAKYIRDRKDEEKKSEEEWEITRKNIFEEFVKNVGEEFFSSFDGLHFYIFTSKKIKFGFNPSEVAHVWKRVKFICILKHTGKYWTIGRNTIPANWKERIFDLFYKAKSVMDDDIVETIIEMHSIFMDWAKEHAWFCRRKIERYRNGEIDFFDLDSEDEELYLSPQEKRELKEKREKILNRMVAPEIPKKKKRTRRVVEERDYGGFEPFPDLGID